MTRYPVSSSSTVTGTAKTSTSTSVPSFRVRVLAIGDQILEVATDRVSGCVPEELLGRQVPRGDLPVETQRDDCGRADLQQRLEVELLLSESARALGRKAF